MIIWRGYLFRMARQVAETQSLFLNKKNPESKITFEIFYVIYKILFFDDFV